jgi:hypothetical protein
MRTVPINKVLMDGLFNNLSAEEISKKSNIPLPVIQQVMSSPSFSKGLTGKYAAAIAASIEAPLIIIGAATAAARKMVKRMEKSKSEMTEFKASQDILDRTPSTRRRELDESGEHEDIPQVVINLPGAEPINRPKELSDGSEETH